MAWVLRPDPTSTPCGPLSNGGTFGPGWILGAPSASSCPGACGSSFSEGLTPEGTQTSWDKDIPEINQGEGTVPRRRVVGHRPCGVVRIAEGSQAEKSCEETWGSLVGAHEQQFHLHLPQVVFLDLLYVVVAVRGTGTSTGFSKRPDESIAPWGSPRPVWNSVINGHLKTCWPPGAGVRAKPGVQTQSTKPRASLCGVSGGTWNV